MKILTVVNRLKGIPFSGMYDGQTYEVEDKLAVPDHVAFHLKRQSIYRDNPIDPSRNEYRLYIEGVDEPPQEKLTELPLETLDRSDMDPRAQKVQILSVPGARPAAPARKAGGAFLDLGERTK